MSRPTSSPGRAQAFAFALALALLLAAAPARSAEGAVAAEPAASAAAAAPAAGASASAAPAPAAATATAPASLERRVQEVKAAAIALERDLLVLEEELLYPAGTQVALFLSMDVGRLFALGSVQVRLDDQVVAAHLYTPLEVQALHRGGMQRLYLGNLRSGEHELVAFFTGEGPHDREYRRATRLKFDKGNEPRYIELRIVDSQARLQPEFDVKVWP